MSFQVSYIGGGVLDKVKELPHPHFSKFTVPLVKGRKIIVEAERKSFTDIFTLPYNAEFITVAVACSEYNADDYWELTLDGVKVCETIYTKGLPESVSAKVVVPIAADKEIKFQFFNMSGVAKDVWFNVKFLR